MSFLWLVVAFVQPRWRRQISSQAGLDPSAATTLAALLAKTIELSFVTVFISFLGQVLSRRSIIRKARGVTLAEMTMRNWVIQPGSLLTHGETVRDASLSFLGCLTLIAAALATFYTTASDAMVAPKLKQTSWENIQLSGHVRTSYANLSYIEEGCSAFFSASTKEKQMCMAMQFSADSYRDLLSLFDTWALVTNQGSRAIAPTASRPVPTFSVLGNVTIESSWIDGPLSKMTDRVINNATLGIPHSGVYAAATADSSDIMQPNELSDVGGYTVIADVVSPYINVLCANMDADELAPLVYTEWPNSNTTLELSGVLRAPADWYDEVPRWASDDDRVKEYLNRTVVDDLFGWGPKYGSQPPVFETYPPESNLIVNSTLYLSNSVYLLGKSPSIPGYTLCALKSGILPNCSTELRVSGSANARMSTRCSGVAADRGSAEWKWIGHSWRLSMDINGGVSYSNGSNALALTRLFAETPELSNTQPSAAEGIAAYAMSTVAMSVADSPFVNARNAHDFIIDNPGRLQSFDARVQRQEYTSGHTSDWQGIFYVVLAGVTIINVLCLAYLLLHSGLVTDFTEPQNLFALAMNSPPSIRLKGACGGGPVKGHFSALWQVGYAPTINHYFFKEGLRESGKGQSHLEEPTSIGSSESLKEGRGMKFREVSASKRWL